MDFSFFITDNKSGHKTRESWVKTNFPELYNMIISYCNDLNLDLCFKEKIWFYFNKLKERPKCLTCGNDIKFRNRFDKPYGEFCSLTCINENKEEMLKRQKKTFQKKYGVNFFPEHDSFIEKQKKTKKNRYNDENYNNLEKAKKTKLIKYGNELFNNIEKQKLTCIKNYGTENYSKSKYYNEKIFLEYKNRYPNIDIIELSKENVSIKCHKCNKISELTKQLLYERHKLNYDTCINCNPIGQSNQSGHEKELSSFLTSLNIPHEKSKRNLISKELDIFIPQNNLAIEINGLYWHNELFLSSDYHLQKTISCNKINVNLIHVFEDEWVYKKDIVKSIIKNKVNKIDNTIYARKCIVKEINNKECEFFLNENHIQGKLKSKIKIGLFYNEELVSVMTFSQGRLIMGGKTDEWELTRFSNKINTKIIGSASKMFNFFLKKYNPNKIISYSDVRLFDGKIYEKLGFLKIGQSKPNYWYVINGLRYYRFNFRKSKLVKEGFDKNKTEKEIMFDRKIYRIYDCGNIRWEYSLKNK